MYIITCVWQRTITLTFLLQSAQKATQLALTAFGRLDGAVINHGALSPMTRLENASVEEWKALYDANLFSALALVSSYHATSLLRSVSGY